MELKNKHIAIAYDNKGKVIHVCKCKTVSERELNELLNQEQQQRDSIEKEKYVNNEKLKANANSIDKLFRRDLLIAKALYDKFVDRGLIEDDKEFDQKFYEYIFNGKLVKREDYPEEYKTILKRLGEL